MISGSVKQLVRSAALGQPAQVEGWVYHLRKQKKWVFCKVRDGLSFDEIQLVLNRDQCPDNLTVGSAVRASGILQDSPGPEQPSEIQVDNLSLIGSSEHLSLRRADLNPRFPFRAAQHLRAKTESFAALMRVRHRLVQTLHQWFDSQDFVHVDVPTITINDCEGAGQVFSVSSEDHAEPLGTPPDADKDSDKKGEGSGHYFDQPAFLTVSGQLHLEAIASGIKRVYSMTRAFRAEKSHPRRHLAEFTMIEAELAFMDNLEDLITVVRNMMTAMSRCLLEECFEDAQVVIQHNAQDAAETMKVLENLSMSESYTTITYAEALALLERRADSFQIRPRYGIDLAKEHEEFIVESCNNRPVFVTLFPAGIKPFYMQRNPQLPDACDCFDLLTPKALETCGGSLREPSYDALTSRIEEELKDSADSLKWYSDLRKYGHAPTAGFGLGFERFIKCALGIHYLRDTVTFPRYYKHCYM